jgi:hypothetical protein
LRRIHQSQQYADPEAGRFFSVGNVAGLRFPALDDLRAGFAATFKRFATGRSPTRRQKPRIASRCQRPAILNDLLHCYAPARFRLKFRWWSNHPDLQSHYEWRQTR